AAGMTVDDLRRLAATPDAGAALDQIRAHCLEMANEDLRGWTPHRLQHYWGIVQWGSRVASLASSPISRDHFELLDQLQCNLSSLKRGSRASELARQLRDEMVPQLRRALVTAYYAPQRRTLLDAIDRFDALYRKRKRLGGMLDFADLEEFAVRLLEDKREIREQVRRQFDQILMDEFQDTNGQQSRLLELLRSENRFYAVGDINQSIYGFRHADPEVFRGYRDSVVRDGKRLAELRENWRSRAAILRAVTAAFRDTAGVEPHQFVPAREFDAKAEPSVEVISAVGPDVDSAMAIEAQWVARRIVELCETARPADIALLFRTTTPMPVFARALDAAGIPYAIAGGRGFYEEQEITDLIHLLRIVANPRDEISLAAVLRSPLAGMSDDVLLRLRSFGNLADGIEHVDEVATVRDRLRRDRSERDLISADRILMRWMDETGYELALTPRARSNVDKFLNFVRDAAGRMPIDRMVDEIAVLRASDPREADPAGEDAGNAVRLQTIHSAKGLEFPVVFLPALHTGVQNETGVMAFSRRHGIGLRWRNPASTDAISDGPHKALREELREQREHESHRLLYVAMTRAGEHLVLSCSATLRAVSGWAELIANQWNLDLRTPTEGRRIEARESFDVRLVVTTAAPELVRLPAREAAADPFELLDAAQIEEQHDSAVSVTSVALFAHCPRRYYLARYIGWQREARAILDEEADESHEPDELDATEFGSQVHALLAGTAIENPDPQAVVLAERFRGSKLGMRAASTLLAAREFDIMLAVDDVVLRGQIDLWFEDRGELILVDYKTDSVTAEEAAERAGSYRIQMQLYALALERFTGRPPDRAYLYFLRPDVPVEVELSGGSAVEAVRALKKAQSNLDFPLHEGDHCRRCPFFRGLCPAGL
ncbi:MAG: UvrD-helicase domain-containing protein, partial [Bryobacteraceae bacterium]